MGELKAARTSLGRLASLTAISICIASGLGSARAHGAIRPCVTPSPYQMEYLDTVVVSSDSDFGIAPRHQLNLPAGPVSMVSAVTDTTICRRAALAAAFADSTSIDSVSVVRVGATRYIVTDESHRIGEFRPSFTFDSAFTLPPLAKWGS